MAAPSSDVKEKGRVEDVEQGTERERDTLAPRWERWSGGFMTMLLVLLAGFWILIVRRSGRKVLKSVLSSTDDSKKVVGDSVADVDVSGAIVSSEQSGLRLRRGGSAAARRDWGSSITLHPSINDNPYGPALAKRSDGSLVAAVTSKSGSTVTTVFSAADAEFNPLGAAAPDLTGLPYDSYWCPRNKLLEVGGVMMHFEAVVSDTCENPDVVRRAIVDGAFVGDPVTIIDGSEDPLLSSALWDVSENVVAIIDASGKAKLRVIGGDGSLGDWKIVDPIGTVTGSNAKIVVQDLGVDRVAVMYSVEIGGCVYIKTRVFNPSNETFYSAQAAVTSGCDGTVITRGTTFSLMPDPESEEFVAAFVEYDGSNFILKLQRVNKDGALIGDAISDPAAVLDDLSWDAVSADPKNGGTVVTGGFAWEVGAARFDATGALGDIVTVEPSGVSPVAAVPTQCGGSVVAYARHRGTLDIQVDSGDPLPSFDFAFAMREDVTSVEVTTANCVVGDFSGDRALVVFDVSLSRDCYWTFDDVIVSTFTLAQLDLATTAPGRLKLWHNGDEIAPVVKGNISGPIGCSGAEDTRSFEVAVDYTNVPTAPEITFAEVTFPGPQSEFPQTVQLGDGAPSGVTASDRDSMAFDIKVDGSTIAGVVVHTCGDQDVARFSFPGEWFESGNSSTVCITYAASGETHLELWAEDADGTQSPHFPVSFSFADEPKTGGSGGADAEGSDGLGIGLSTTLSGVGITGMCLSFAACCIRKGCNVCYHKAINRSADEHKGDQFWEQLVEPFAKRLLKRLNGRKCFVLGRGRAKEYPPSVGRFFRAMQGQGFPNLTGDSFARLQKEHKNMFLDALVDAVENSLVRRCMFGIWKRIPGVVAFQPDDLEDLEPKVIEYMKQGKHINQEIIKYFIDGTLPLASSGSSGTSFRSSLFADSGGSGVARPDSPGLGIMELAYDPEFSSMELLGVSSATEVDTVAVLNAVELGRV